ncbi:MAG: NAD(P)H-hydrate dehydratase [Bacteroidales bacterium]|nr:NAD(P)H-hydrate dehydratase [Bacteroidales bacterium]
MTSVNISYLQGILHRRDPFAHKGDFGRGLLIAGCREMCGAAILAARASLRSGIGLLHVHAAASIYDCLQAAVPEAMVQRDARHNDHFADEQLDIEKFDAVALGPGLGQGPDQGRAIHALLHQNASFQKPMVIDADALNILASQQDWLHLLGPHCILTPHPKEFERLIQSSQKLNYDERLEKGIAFAQKHQVHLVLKGAQTAVIQPNGEYHINTSGNPGMASGGSGDVLTGILLSLLAQRYCCSDAALLGVYIHGLSGDIALKHESEESLVASDLYRYLGEAFKTLK